jgi:hypothetical protein
MTFMQVACIVAAFALGLSISLVLGIERRVDASLANVRLRKIQCGNDAAYQLWEAMRDDEKFLGAGADYFLGFSHALSLGDVIDADQYRGARVVCGSDI